MKAEMKQWIRDMICFLLLLIAGALFLSLIVSIVPENVPEGEMITFFSRGSIQTAIDEGRLPPEIGQRLLECMSPRYARVILRWQGLREYREHPEKCSISIDSDFDVIAH